MINYISDKKLLTLSNGSIAYVLYINDAGYVEKVYFGKALANLDDFAQVRDAKYFTSSYYDTSIGAQKMYTDGFMTDTALMELSPHAVWDKHHSAIVLRDKSGSYESDFRYHSHKIYGGVPVVEEPMPHAKGESAQTLEILYKDMHRDIFVTEYLTIYQDKDIIVKSFAVENKTESQLSLLRAMSMQLDLSSKDYTMVTFPGRWSRERTYQERTLGYGTQQVSSNLGHSSHDMNPFVFLKAQNATMDYGEVIGFNLIYSGNFLFRADVSKYNCTQISYGLNDEDFCWSLASGARFVTPQAVISYSYQGVDKMSQNFHAFIKQNLISYKADRDYKPVLFNSWEGCYFTFDTESVISYINDAVKIGTELFVLDDGWFGTRNDDTSSLGDWFVNKSKVDLHKVIDHCKQIGIKFGIWFEPEMINPNSQLFREHPEYVLGNLDNKQLSLTRNQMHLDFANPQVVDCIYNQMKAFLDEYPVDYIKWDYNRSVSEHVSKAHGTNQGEIYHRLVLGYYQLISRLTKEYPNIMFEGCSGGGGRFDMGTLYFAPQIWTSDQSNPAERMFINYNTSLGYPLSTMGAHVNDSKMGTYTTKALLAMFGTYGYEMNPNVLTAEEMEELYKVAQLYKGYHNGVIANGTLYHLLSPNDSNFTCLQCVAQDTSTSLVLLMSKLSNPAALNFLKLKGLDPNKKYSNNIDNCVHTGEYYMQVGINLSVVWFSEFTAYLAILTEVE